MKNPKYTFCREFNCEHLLGMSSLLHHGEVTCKHYLVAYIQQHHS